MKTLQILLVLAISVFLTPVWAAQNNAGIPKYDKSTEAIFRGTVEEVHDHPCPISGGIGSHLMLRLSDGKVIEVHLSTTKFLHQYEVTFHPGENLEVTGVKVNFEGAETILARKVKRGNDEFLFRDEDGNPIW